MLRTWQRCSRRSRIASRAPRRRRGPQAIGHALVRGDQDRAAAVAVGDEAKEEARFVAAHGLEADLVDHEQRDVHVLALPQARGVELGVPLERGEEVLQPVKGDGEAVLDRPHGERHREMRLPDAGRALQQQALPLPDPRAGGERLDAAPLDARLEGKVEIAKGLPGRQPREAQRRAHAPLVARRQLGLEQPVEKPVRRIRLLRRGGDVLVEPVGRVEQAEPREPLARAIEIDLRRLFRERGRGRRRLGRHRATSASAAYRSIGRRCGASAHRSWSLRPMRPSGVGAATRSVLGPS